MRQLRRQLLLAACALAAPLLPFAPSRELPRTGPQTEKRFPPLRVPDGFQATLFACDPCVAYPSAIAAGPRPGSLFVAVDYLTGLGTSLERHDEVRLLGATRQNDGGTMEHAAADSEVEGRLLWVAIAVGVAVSSMTSYRCTTGQRPRLSGS
jgi:hypothetical protein